MSDLIGRTLGHYQIVEQIGVGGMGVVFRAHDKRLDRDVAIKFLPEALAEDPDRLARFEREAKALAALNHPNIATIHGFETVDWSTGRETVKGSNLGPHAPSPTTFLVMELLEGSSLRHLIPPQGMDWKQALEIGAAVADGLAAAHVKGIIHRDLKPENIFVTDDGRVKILDFGLAKIADRPLVELETATSPIAGTAPGSLLGTVGYMAPEQVRGQAADARSDIFSLGCVLYEMATGAAPFRCASVADSLASVLRDDPVAISFPDASAAAALNRLVARCLAKRPEQRFQSSSDLAFALRAGLDRGSRTDASVAPPRNMIVVLPFANLSPDPENEYFSDGLTEEIIADLSRIASLRVISRTSSMRFKGSRRSVREIAAELNVSYVLEGSVRRAGNSLRITAQLIDASTDSHLWAEKYDGVIDDVFDMQERVSRTIVDSLELKLSPREQRLLAHRSFEDPRAFDAWLRAKQAGLTMTRSGFMRGGQLIDHAIDLVGDNPLLLATRGWLKLVQHTSDVEAGRCVLEEAERLARRALELAPDHAWARFVLAVAHHRKGDLQEFVNLCLQSLELERNSHVLATLAAYLGEVGRTSRARHFANEALAIDPLAWMSVWACGYLDLLEGRAGDALSRLREGAERLAPGEPWPAFIVAYAAVHAGEDTEALAGFAEAARSRSMMWSDIGAMFHAALEGDRRRVITEYETRNTGELAARSGHSSIMVASCFAHAGEDELAIEWVRHGVEMGFTNHRFLDELSPLLRPLREDARMRRLIDRARHAESSFLVSSADSTL